MRKLSGEIQNNIVSLTESGNSTRQIAERLGISQSAVVSIQKRRKLTPKPQVSGRKKLLKDSDARLMMSEMRKNKNLTPKGACLAINKNVSEWTARRALQDIGYMSIVKKNKPALSDKNVKARLKFAKDHKNWTIDDWKRVVWSDESKFNRFQSDGKQYCWIRPGDRVQRHHVKQTVKHGGGNIMVWGCFTWWHIGPLQLVEGIMKKEDYLRILQTNLPNYFDKCAYPEKDIIFQQDGDPKHTAKIVKEWIGKQHFQLMEWPAQSPDLNPIENLWSIVKRRLGQYDSAPKNMGDLWERVAVEWSRIPQDILRNLVESMPKRVTEVIVNKGLWTKY
ncbi:transposase [Wolbachia endosymbiont of Drosophila ananassae]|nr:transposase [Wolbachia endosymbiont of Drosophila ananassae]